MKHDERIEYFAEVLTAGMDTECLSRLIKEIDTRLADAEFTSEMASYFCEQEGTNADRYAEQ